MKNVFCLWFLIVGVFPRQAIAQNDTDPMCGPISLYAITHYIDTDTSLEQICMLTNYDSNSGTSMYDLYQAAISLNLQVTPLKLSYNKLCDLNLLCIVHVDGNHFGVLLDCNESSVIYQDFPFKPMRISKNDFIKRWGGVVLAFENAIIGSRQYTAKIQSAKLDFLQKEFDFGDVYNDDILRHNFIFRNIGGDTLRISYVRTTCTCTASTIDNKIIPPGEYGVIQVELFPEKKNAGYAEEMVIVSSNDPDDSHQTVSVSANIYKSLTCIPGRLWIETYDRNDVLEKVVYLKNNYMNDNIINNIITPPSITYEILPLEKTSSALLSSLPIKFTISPDYHIENDNENTNRIIIKTNDSLVKEIVLPIKGEQQKPVSAYPSRIFVDNNSDNTIVTNIKLQCNQPILQVKTSDNNLVLASLQEESHDNYTIHVTITMPVDTNKINESITVITEEHKPVITIPIYVVNK